MTGDDVRQFRGEVRQWTRDAEQLRRMVQGQGVDAKELDEMLRNLRELDDDRVYKDVEELERLQSQVTESMKRFEFDLRRQVEGADAQLLLSGSDDVPEKFRKIVEQYYRSLSKAPEAAKAPEGESRLSESSRAGAIDRSVHAPRHHRRLRSLWSCTLAAGRVGAGLLSVPRRFRQAPSSRPTTASTARSTSAAALHERAQRVWRQGWCDRLSRRRHQLLDPPCRS